MFNLEAIIRPNIKELKPYSSARGEYSGNASIWLDANENPYETDLNRYPDPLQSELKRVVSNSKGVPSDQIFIGNGSDEAIDLLFRAFCEPGKDKAYLFPPTYGMYEVSAQINAIEVVKINLTEEFELPETGAILNAVNSRGLLFVCSPNNPTGTVYPLSQIRSLASQFSGIVVVDEAYIDFAQGKSATSLLDDTPNLVVLQTLSKAYGLAGLRVGMAFANANIITILNSLKPPYNINTLSQQKGIEAILNQKQKDRQVAEILSERTALAMGLKKLPIVKKVYPSEANFILAQFENANTVYQTLRSHGVVIRNRTSQVKDALRISIGTPEENQTLLTILNEIAQ